MTTKNGEAQPHLRAIISRWDRRYPHVITAASRPVPEATPEGDFSLPVVLAAVPIIEELDLPPQ